MTATATMNRRSFVKTAAGAAAATMLAAAPAALADAAAEGQMAPGTYVATARGYMGENTVAVTVDETSILEVAVTESTDVPTYLTQFPIDQIPAAIVANQSTSVDVVTGATFTSFSIMSAVEAALEQAGGKGMFTAAPAKVEKAEAETVECDVLVIGAGMAGCMAAMSAKQADFDGADSGLDVVLLEKQAFIGGSTPLAYGGFFTVTPLEQQPLQSYVDSEIARFQALSFHDLNEPLITSLMNVAGDTVLKMQQIGQPLMTVGQTGIEQPAELVGLTFNSEPSTAFPFNRNDWKTMWGCGWHYFEVFEVWFKTLGIDLRVNTAATELVIEDGAVVGAKVEGPDSTYEIRAKKVILSCGGFAQNRDMIEQYAPHDAASQVWSNGGADGDGIRMGLDAGGRTVGDRLWGHVCTTSVYGFHNGADDVIAGNGFLVNKNGEKFVDNGCDNSMAYALIAEQPDAVAFTVVDANAPYVADLEAGLASGKYDGYVFKADTLDELAEMCEIDAANLAETVAAYNDHLVTRGEVDWRAYDYVEGSDFMGATPIEEGPFYAVRYIQVHLGSCVGLVVDGDCRVLDDADEPIANLYATGECCIGGNVFDMHVGGWGIGGACYSGRIAGETAKTELLA